MKAADSGSPDEPEDIRATEPSGLDLVRHLQMAANEQLVLSVIRAEEDVEKALEAQRHAEIQAEALAVHTEQLRVTAEFRERMIGIIGHACASQ